MLIDILLKFSVFLDIIHCSPLKVTDISIVYFMSIFWVQYSSYLLHTGFLLDLTFDPEPGGNVVLQNVSGLSATT
jgi:hypothetical protein